MITIIHYEVSNIAGAIVVDADLCYANARTMIPLGGKYKGMHKIEKIDIKIGTRLVHDTKVE